MPNMSNHHRPPRPTAEQLKRATKPAMIRVAPCLYAPDPAADGVPEFSIGKYVERQPGKYELVPVLENFARVNMDLLRKLGLAGQWNTLCRLARASFVEMILVSPGCYLLNLDSYYNHVRRCAETGPEFWEPGKGNLEAYRKAL